MNRAARRAHLARSGKSQALANVNAALNHVQALQQATSGAVQGMAAIEPALKELNNLGTQLQAALGDHDRLVKQVNMMQYVIERLGERVEPGYAKKLATEYWFNQAQEVLNGPRKDDK